MLGQQFLALVVAVVCVSEGVRAVPFDRVTEQDVTHSWFEVGFKSISDSAWTTITTRNDGWAGDRDVVVFVSLPSLGGALHTEGLMVGPKLQQEAVRNPDNTFTFTVKLVQANDSFCLRNWSTPTLLGEIQLSWMVVEKGAYFLDGHSMIIDSGNINRVDNSGSATVANGNAVRLNYPVGCDGDNSLSCTTTDVSDRTQLGALQQLQTSVNTVDGDKDLFLSVRTRIINIRHIQLVMYPHSSTDPAYFELTTPEVVGYFVFAAFDFVCAESMVFETAIHEGVTSDAIYVPYKNHFDYNPGLFGTLGTTISLIDATTIRSFNSSTIGSNFITQEDQCVTEQTDHTTSERVFTMVVGEVRGSSSNFSCNIMFNSATSTVLPSSSPSSEPSPLPTVTPTSSPTATPTSSPTVAPTTRPTLSPSEAQTATPTGACNAAEFEVKFTKTPKAR